MSSQTRRCLVRGSINIDEFYLLPHIVRPGETISSTGFSRKAGGKGANQAYSVARAGGSVDLDGCIGSDGVWVRELLNGAGVGVDRLRVIDDEVTGRAVIQRSEDGENSIVLHKGANYHVSPTDIKPDLSLYTHLLLQNEIPLDSTLSYLTASSTITSVFNPSPMLTVSELRAFPWSHLSWLIVNEGELETLLDAFDARQPVQHGRALSDTAKEGILALHQSRYFSKEVSIICTLGAQGILYFQRGRDVGCLPAGRLFEPVKDTTGAGDCFAGYFTAGLMAASEGDSIELILQTCLMACAICVEKEGAMESVPSKEEVRRRM